MRSTTERVENPLPASIHDSYAQLASAANELNAAANELGSVVAKIEREQQGLNVGVPSWVSFQGDEDAPLWWSDDLGYAKVHNKWGLAIRSVEGHYERPEHDQTIFVACGGSIRRRDRHPRPVPSPPVCR